MKKFLLKILVFALVIFVLALGLDRMICKGLLAMEDYRFQDYSAMLGGGMDNDLLIMGNSRGKSHFDPYIIDSICHTSSFCIGVGGYPINVQRVKYELYKEHNRKPRIVIQNVDHMTVDVFEDIRHQHQSEQFFPLVYDPLMRKELKSVGYGFNELCIPLFRMFGYQKDVKDGLLEFFHLKHHISRPAYKGHRPEYGQWDDTELDNMAVRTVELSEQGKRAFESLMDEYRKDSVSVVLINSPMYSGAKEKLLGLDKVQQYFSGIAERYGAYYLDYTDIDICRDTSNFCVSVHMNPEATREFTELFCHDLDSLGIVR